MNKYNNNKAYKGARLIRANANIGEHYYDLVSTQGYDEFPVDPAILQEAENYVSRTGEMISFTVKARINSKKSKGFARGYTHKTINRF